MKWISALSGVLLAAAGAVGSEVAAADRPETAPFRQCAVEGWRLALQAWTFNRLTLFQTIDKARELGIEDLEA